MSPTVRHLGESLHWARDRAGRLLTSPEAKRVYNDRLTYLSPRKMRRLEQAVKDATEAAPGDVVEFGIALGGSAIVLAKHSRQEGRTFHGFDVFGMIPPPTSDKDGADAKARYQVIAAGQSSGIRGDEYYGYRDDLFSDVCAAFERHGVEVDDSHVRLHRGLFEQTLMDFPMNPIAFAHLDCDWFDPVALCLRAVHDRSHTGTVIVLDDYNDYSGCRRATDEFLAEHRDYHVHLGANAILTRR